MTVIAQPPVHQALYRRWRAQTFGQVLGQDAVVTTLRNAVRDGRVAHALLFVGPRGTGKTSTARILAKALNCPNVRDGEPCDACPSCDAIREGRALDVIELDAASNNKVDDIRDLLRSVATSPSDLRRKVFIIDEVQRIKEGWDVLLKTLEEPPEHVAFIFCTTDSSGIRPAVLSRVQRFDFRRVAVSQIVAKLRTILAADERAADDDAVRLIAELAAGGMRDAESMLDQLLGSGAERITAEQVRDLLGMADDAAVERYVRSLVDGQALAGIAVLDELEQRGRDPRVFLDQVVEALRAALIAGLGEPTGQDAIEIAAAARRLAAIDPTGPAAGGLRFQLELAVLSAQPANPARASAEPTVPRSAAKAAPVPESVPAPQPAPEPGAEPGAAPAPSLAPEPARRTRPARGTGQDPEPSAPPASPAPAEPPRSAREPEPGGDALEQLRRGWPDVVARISQHPPTRPLIVECRPIAVDGNVVTLGFPESKAFLREIAERRRSILEEGIGSLLGRAVAVRCVATNLDAFAALPADTESERLLAEARRIFADDLVDVGDVS